MIQNCNPPNFRTTSLIFVTALILFMASPAPAAGSGDLYKNLEPLEDTQIALFEVDPNTDFSVFKKVKLLDAFVEFRSGWERDQIRSASRMRISKGEIERIKTSVADLLNKVLTEVLEADDGYEVVKENGEDVLLLRPAIIDLDVVAPDGTDASRGTTFTDETGSATLYIELYDSISNQIIGRATDHRMIGNTGDQMTWSNRASNSAGTRGLFTAWAQVLRDFLDKRNMNKD